MKPLSGEARECKKGDYNNIDDGEITKAYRIRRIYILT